MLKVFLKRWIFLSIIIVSDLIISLQTGREFFYFFFWFLVSLVAISFILMALEYLCLKKLYLERRVVGKIEEDDVLEIETVIKNNSPLPIFNFVLEDYVSCTTPQERKKRTLLEYLGAKSSISLKYSSWCPQRGKYKIGPFFIYIFDPWGLFFLKKAYFIYSELYVYPQTFNIQKLPPLVKGTAPWFGIETGRVSGDEHEFYGIREYKQGDPIKKIHWFSTARKNKLIVKQFQHHVFFRATIIFNLDKDRNFGKGKESVVEYTIKIAASVAKYLIERDVSLEIIAHTGEIVYIPFNKGPEHLEDIFRLLAVAQAESRISLGEIFQEFSNYIPNDSSLIVIMSDKDWEYLSAMLSLKNRNVSLIPLILITSSFLDPSDKQRVIKDVQMKLPQAFGSPPIFFSCGDSLEEPFLNY